MTPDLLPPYAAGLLELNSIHSMYWEQTGNPEGQAVVLLHGGPGAGIDSSATHLFDTRHYRIIAYDQRGAGRSRPAGMLSDNTTQHLIEDLEVLRKHLEIDRWLVAGGSWGSALALAYGQQYSRRVSGFILRGVFLCRPSEINWYFHGIKHIYPDAWHQFVEHIPVEERDHAAAIYYRHLLDPDPSVHLPAARQWCLYEARCATLLPDPDLHKSLNAHKCHVLAKIQAHYFQNGFFVDSTQLLNNIEKIRAIPTQIIQGRYDMICPPVSAYQLKKAWPEAQLRMVANAGHSISEPAIRRALCDASEKFKTIHPMELV